MSWFGEHVIAQFQVLHAVVVEVSHLQPLKAPNSLWLLTIFEIVHSF